MIIDGLALTNALRFGPLASPGSTWQIPSDTTYGDGCLLVVNQLAENATAAIPSHVLPSGWSAITNGLGTLTDEHGNGLSIFSSYKLMTDADRGAVVTGMTATRVNSVAGMVMKFNRPITGVVVATAGCLASAAGGLQLTVNDDGVPAPGHIYLGFAHGEFAVLDGDVQFDGQTNPIGSDYGGLSGDIGAVLAARTLYAFYPYNGSTSTAPASNVVMRKNGDSSAYNALTGTLLHLY